MPHLITVILPCVVFVAALAACSSQTPAGSAAATPSQPPIPVDGTYGGVMQLSRGDAISCGNDNPIIVQVENHAFTYQLDQPRAEWRPSIVFNATIDSQGAFNARSGPNSMSGRVAEGTMQGQIVGDICGFSFVAARGGAL